MENVAKNCTTGLLLLKDTTEAIPFSGFQSNFRSNCVIHAHTV